MSQELHTMNRLAGSSRRRYIGKQLGGYAKRNQLGSYAPKPAPTQQSQQDIREGYEGMLEGNLQRGYKAGGR